MDYILLSGNIQECLPPKIQYGIFPSHYWKEFRSGQVKTGHVKRLLTSHLVKLGNIFSLVTLIFSNTPLVEVKQAQNTWSYRQISKFSTTWKYSQSGHTITYPYTPLVEVKQAQNAWSLRQISELESLKAHVLAWGVRQQQSLQSM